MYICLNDLSELYEAVERSPLNEDEYWLILIADRHTDQLNEIVAHLSDNSVRFCGALFPGLVVDKRTFYQGAILRKITCKSPPVILPMPASPEAVVKNLPLHTELDKEGETCLTFIDCLSEDIDVLLTSLYDRFSNYCSYFGAGAGRHDLADCHCVFDASGLYSKAALVAIVNQPSQCHARHGWSRHAGPIVASRTTNNILHELDWEVAETAYRNTLPENLKNTPPELFYRDVTPRYPFAVEYPGSEDVVRDPISICANGDVAFLSDIPQGALMYLVEGTPDSLINAAKEAVELSIQENTESLLVCDCLSRTIALDSKFPAELRAVYDQVNSVKDGITVEGVIALGEIASNGDQQVNFFNKTFGICCFNE